MVDQIRASSVSASNAMQGTKNNLRLTFPNFAQDGLRVRAGGNVTISVPKTQVGDLQPPDCEHNSPPIYNGWVEWMVDGKLQQPIQFAQPHYTGSGGYDGTETTSITLKIPADANDVQFWFHTKNTAIARTYGWDTERYIPGQYHNYDVKVER